MSVSLTFTAETLEETVAAMAQFVTNSVAKAVAARGGTTAPIPGPISTDPITPPKPEPDPDEKPKLFRRPKKAEPAPVTPIETARIQSLSAVENTAKAPYDATKDFEACRIAGRLFGEKWGGKELRLVLQRFTANRISDLKPADLPFFIERLRERQAALETSGELADAIK